MGSAMTQKVTSRTAAYRGRHKMAGNAPPATKAYDSARQTTIFCDFGRLTVALKGARALERLRQV
jgi:hypothetical protein